MSVPVAVKNIVRDVLGECLEAGIVRPADVRGIVAVRLGEAAVAHRDYVERRVAAYAAYAGVLTLSVEERNAVDAAMAAVGCADTLAILDAAQGAIGGARADAISRAFDTALADLDIAVDPVMARAEAFTLILDITRMSADEDAAVTDALIAVLGESRAVLRQACREALGARFAEITNALRDGARGFPRVAFRDPIADRIQAAMALAAYEERA